MATKDPNKTYITDEVTPKKRGRKSKAEKEAEAAAAAIAAEEEAAATSSKTTKKKGNGQKPILPKRGQWSDPGNSLVTERMYVELELLEEALGTNPSDKELYSTYIASKAPDAATKEEEISAFGETEMEKKQLTVFMKGWFQPSANGQFMIDPLDRSMGGDCKVDKDSFIKVPFFWNYQVRGMFKDAAGLLSKGKYGLSADMSAYKKMIDGNIFVHPRRIAIDVPEFYFDENMDLIKCDPDNLSILQRPLRINGPQGERTAIATSETIPAGSRIKFMIEYTDPKLRDVIIEWLNYGANHGLGAWRNSGKGSFRWREINEDFSPIEFEDEEE